MAIPWGKIGGGLLGGVGGFFTGGPAGAVMGAAGGAGLSGRTPKGLEEWGSVAQKGIDPLLEYIMRTGDRKKQEEMLSMMMETMRANTGARKGMAQDYQDRRKIFNKPVNSALLNYLENPLKRTGPINIQPFQNYQGPLRGIMR